MIKMQYSYSMEDIRIFMHENNSKESVKNCTFVRIDSIMTVTDIMIRGRFLYAGCIFQNGNPAW